MDVVPAGAEVGEPPDGEAGGEGAGRRRVRLDGKLGLSDFFYFVVRSAGGRFVRPAGCPEKKHRQTSRQAGRQACGWAGRQRQAPARLCVLNVSNISRLCSFNAVRCCQDARAFHARRGARLEIGGWERSAEHREDLGWGVSTDRGGRPHQKCQQPTAGQHNN